MAQQAAMQDAELLGTPVDEYSQIRTVLDKLFDACLEFHRPDHPDLEAEVTLYGDGLRLREFAMGHVWTVPAVQEEFDYQRSVRVRSCIRPLLALGGFTCVAMQPLWPLALEGDLWGAERVGGDVWPLPSSSVASLAWKPSWTCLASTSVRLFLARRIRCAQTAASSGEATRNGLTAVQPAMPNGRRRCGRRSRRHRGLEIGRIDVVFSSNSHQREECITPGIGQCGSHAVGRCRLADRADRPVGGNPLPRRMRQNCREIDDTGALIDRRRLYGRDLMLA